MSTEYKGIFSLGLKSAELQLATLFDNVGGAKLVDLLDKLGKFSTAEQENLLTFFSEVIDKEIPTFEEDDHKLLKDIDLKLLYDKPISNKNHKSGKVLRLHDFKRHSGT